MTTDERSLFEHESAEEKSAAEGGHIRDRVETLREKTSQLSETLDRVEESLKEAGGNG